MNVKYQVTKLYNVIYCLLFLFAVALIIARWYSGLNLDFVVINKTIQSHISNFSLSLVICLGSGYLALNLYGKMRPIYILSFIMILANIVCETVITLLNTPDIIDALSGVLGVVVALGYLKLAHKYGLVEVSNKK